MRLLTLLLLVGCGKGEDSGVDDPSDCSAEPAPEIVEVGWTCDVTKFFFWADVSGYTTGGTLRVRHVGGAEESHPLDDRIVPFPGCNSELSAELNIIEPETGSEPGWSIAFACDDDSDGDLIWHLAVEDAGGAEVDCATWGADPESMGVPDCPALLPPE